MRSYLDKSSSETGIPEYSLHRLTERQAAVLRMALGLLAQDAQFFIANNDIPYECKMEIQDKIRDAEYLEKALRNIDKLGTNVQIALNPVT